MALSPLKLQQMIKKKLARQKKIDCQDNSTHCWVDYVFFNGLTGILEGTGLTRFGELVFVFIVGFNVKILDPSTEI